MTRTPIPQLSHADRRAQLDALMANYTGPITHLASVKLSRSGVRRLNPGSTSCVRSAPAPVVLAEGTSTTPDFYSSN
jgi:hypothetical protein